MSALAVFIGGGLGSLSRYAISVLALRYIGTSFPWGTFVSNTLACLIMALLIGMFEEKLAAQPFYRFLLLTGFCGGFSTFSTFSYETFELFKTGHNQLAIANVLLSLAMGLFVMYVLVRNIQTNA